MVHWTDGMSGYLFELEYTDEEMRKQEVQQAADRINQNVTSKLRPSQMAMPSVLPWTGTGAIPKYRGALQKCKNTEVSFPNSVALPAMFFCFF